MTKVSVKVILLFMPKSEAANTHCTTRPLIQADKSSLRPTKVRFSRSQNNEKYINRILVTDIFQALKDVGGSACIKVKVVYKFQTLKILNGK